VASHYTVEIMAITSQSDSGWFAGRCRALPDPDHDKRLDFRGEMKIAGVCPHIMEGLAYRLEASTDMYQGEKQLRVISGTLERVESIIGLPGVERYLLWIRTILKNTRKDAGLPSLGVGPSKIKDLIDYYKKLSVKALRSDPVKVSADLKSWKLEQAQAFSAELIKHISTEKVLLELATLGANGGLSANDRFNVFEDENYGFQAPDLIRQNPYRLIEDISGIGWRKCDTIAVSNLLWPPACPKRIIAGTVEAMREIEGMSGPRDTFAITQQLFHRGSILTGMDKSYHELFAANDPGLTEMGPFVMTTKSYNAEIDITRIIQERSEKPGLKVRFDSRDDDINKDLNSLQKSAYARALEGGMFILTGGPGRGKTHVCKSIIEGLGIRHKRVLILAPTGRAAARAKELTGNESLTIHAFLRRNETGTDFSNFAYFIVDESSMIDLRLMARFLRSLKDRQSCIFVGDPDQLPPVNSGRPFIDIIRSQLLEVVHLEEVMRTDKLGLIEASQIIKDHDHSKVSDDLRFVECDSFKFLSLGGAKARDVVQRCIEEMQLGGTPNADIQIITATNGYKSNSSGVKTMSNRDFNGLAKPLLNSRGQVTKATCNGGDVLSVGDRVMNLKNDASIPLMNGEMGSFVGIKDVAMKNGLFQKRAIFDFGDGRKIRKDLSANDIQISYAATCHKFQGSESAHVIVVADNSAGWLLDRSWLYTAITRAKSSCTLIAPAKIVNKACGNQAKVLDRKTFLQARLEDNFDPDEIFEKMKIQARANRKDSPKKASTVDALL
jgi:exodeoxyribonuclease V alpha subunit